MKKVFYTTLLLLSCTFLILASGCKKGNNDNKWIKNDSIFGDYEEALTHYKICKVLILRNTMPYGETLHTIKTIDSRIGTLQNLKKLIIYGISQQEIPKEIDKLTNLEVLEIYNFHKKIEPVILPESLEALVNLKELTVEGCRIEKIPALPKNLEKLSMKNNNISTIPNEIFNTKLNSINVSQNQVLAFDIPQKNATLQWLDVSNNKMQRLPGGLSRLEGLDFLSISNNPMTDTTANYANISTYANRIEAIGIDNPIVEALIGEQTKHVWLSLIDTMQEHDYTQKYPQITFIWFGKGK